MILQKYSLFAMRLTCFHGTIGSLGPGTPSYRGSTITLRHTKLHRTPLGELSSHLRNLYLTTNNTHKRQTSVPPALFEPTVPASEQPQTHAQDHVATGIGYENHTKYKYNLWANLRDLCGKIQWISYNYSFKPYYNARWRCCHNSRLPDYIIYFCY